MRLVLLRLLEVFSIITLDFALLLSYYSLGRLSNIISSVLNDLEWI